MILTYDDFQLTSLCCRLIKVAGCSTAPGNKLLMIFLFRLLTLVSRFAGAMKPLNVLPKFENHFANQTVRFQVQLEADGYFSTQKFSSLQPQQVGRVSTNLQFLNPILQIQLQNTCWASPKPDVQHKNTLVPHLNGR